MIKRGLASLFETGSIAPLVAFRIVFGVLVLFSSLRFMVNGWVNSMYIQPRFFFTYYGFDWVHPLHGNWMYLPFILMCLGATGIAMGAFYRVSTSMFFLAFTYVELLDKSNYLNHYYFVSIMAFLLIWMPANRAFSIDSRLNPAIRSTVIPQWPIVLLRAQLGIVYFFAGIAKINSDWLLDAQPLKIWLQAFRDTPLVGNLLASGWVAYFFAWFGCIYDITIPFFLSANRTRSIAYWFVILFHIATWILFPIGIFPWVMICSTLIFFPASFHEKWLTKFIRAKDWLYERNPIQISAIRKRFIAIAVFGFLAIQLIIPMRYLCYPKQLFWHEEGFRFSWRVMLMEKKGYATFYVIDPKTKGSIEIVNTDYLNPTQIDQMSRQPDMILQFAHFIGNKYRDTLLTFGKTTIHLVNPAVKAAVYVTLNGRPNQPFIDPTIDLMHQKYNLKHRTWILPLKD